jgi:hypothetical protein
MDYTEDAIDPDCEQPNTDLVIVSADSVLASKPVNTVTCSDEQQWNETLEEIEDLIESTFKPGRWKECKNFAREILKQPNWCVTTDGRFLFNKDKPNKKISLIDFVGEVTRHVAPKEKPNLKLYRKFKPFAKQLRSTGVHSDMLKNKYI